MFTTNSNLNEGLDIPIDQRKLVREEALVAVGGDEHVVPASEAKQLNVGIRELEQPLGKKTMETEIPREAIEIARSDHIVS